MGVISKIKAGFLLILPAFFYSCKENKQDANTITPEVKIAKTVPLLFTAATDKGFTKHQDTLYYQDKFYTGYRFTLYPGGDTAALESFFNGVEEGMQKKWYPNRQLMEERFYINGKKEGIHRGWWPDGKEKYFFTASNDQYEGEFKEWYTSGLLGKCFHYANGQEAGSQRLWWENGTVRANYVIKNGKKYGLLGLKTCINPYDSLVKK